MTIKIGKFTITHAETSLNYFDLQEVKTVEKGKNKGSEFVDAIAYGISINRALEIVLTKTLNNEKVELNLEEYIEKYKQTSKKVLEEFNASIKANL